MPDSTDYCETAAYLIRGEIQSWLLDESDWYYEDKDMQEYDLEQLRECIRNLLNNI